MRGAQFGHRLGQHGQGIIPADAGSTVPAKQLADTAGDHPRGCGEHDYHICVFCFAGGSSPRMRGAHWSSVSRADYGRIIPADAGST